MSKEYCVNEILMLRNVKSVVESPRETSRNHLISFPLMKYYEYSVKLLSCHMCSGQKWSNSLLTHATANQIVEFASKFC